MNKFCYLDGAMGTMLQRSALKLGEKPELLNMTHPELIENIHREYFESGSDIVYTNTFGANRKKLEECGYSVTEIVTAAVQIAKNVCPPHKKVALDLGPIGEMIEPTGSMTFEEAYDIYKEQITAGVNAGCDVIAIETQTDLYELKAAILAAQEHSSLDILVSMSFEKNHKTFTGCSIESFVSTADGLGVTALGINCSLGPDEIFPIIEKISKLTNKDLLVKANAGLPDPITNEFAMNAEDFSNSMKKISQLGVKYLGGCCGSDPEYIALLVQKTEGHECDREINTLLPAVCSPTNYVPINDVRIIGERINPTGKKRFKQALADKDYNYILKLALEQADDSAAILDVNVGAPGVDEPAMMKDLVKRIQSITDLPLQIDSSNVQAIESGLRAYNGKPIVNSVNGEEKSMEQILPLVKKYGAAVVGLTLDEDGIPKNAEKRFEIAKRILNRATQLGIKKEDVYIDCLTLTVSAEQAQVQETLRAMQMIKDQLGLKLVLGVSNISFGLPNRSLINKTFLTLAMEHGLQLPIINPSSNDMIDAISAFRVLHGDDLNSDDYIERQQQTEDTKSEKSSVKQDITLDVAVRKGLKEEVRRTTLELLQSMKETDIIDQILIPALDVVGKDFESGKIYLPQLIKSATASQVAFELIKENISKNGSQSISKGKIILATVKGDIHDIGKNIVKVVLENYGYQIIDLGRNVPVELVVDMAIKEDVKLIGLSALMTTTLVSMEETIKALRESGHVCKIMVGGAVLTPDYALKIGADYYSKDANQGVEIAREVFSNGSI